MSATDDVKIKKIKKEKKLSKREIEIIGKQLPKSQGYYDWCKKNKIDPETGTVVKDEDKQ